MSACKLVVAAAVADSNKKLRESINFTDNQIQEMKMISTYLGNTIETLMMHFFNVVSSYSI